MERLLERGNSVSLDKNTKIEEEKIQNINKRNRGNRIEG